MIGNEEVNTTLGGLVGTLVVLGRASLITRKKKINKKSKKR